MSKRTKDQASKQVSKKRSRTIQDITPSSENVARLIDVQLTLPDDWFLNVRKDIRTIASRLVNDVSWDWVPPSFDTQALRRYQLFLLCKMTTSDWDINSDSDRLFLSPTPRIDALWHEHMLRPSQYMEMFEVLFPEDRNKSITDGKRVLNHTPESVEDSQEMKDKRVMRTFEYMKQLLPQASIADDTAPAPASTSKVTSTSMKAAGAKICVDNAPVSGGPINLCIVSESGEQLHFKVSKSIPFSKISEAVAERYGMAPRQLSFRGNGNVISLDESVMSLGLQDGDRIYCTIKLGGC